MGLVQGGPLELVTFDGDVTLYDDGASLTEENTVIPHILKLMANDVRIGIVTAAGYTEATRYYDRLHGLLDSIASSKLTTQQKNNIIIMGGESNYLFRFSSTAKCRLVAVPRDEWLLEEMRLWTTEAMAGLLHVAEDALQDCIRCMNLSAQVLRKERAVGIIPMEGKKLAREQLEETVLVTQRALESSPMGRQIPFCAFNGGNDVFVDIGDKAWGVLACQRFFGGLSGAKTLHVGDQFLSAGANDFKARLACTTAWIANPEETVMLLDELDELSAKAGN